MSAVLVGVLWTFSLSGSFGQTRRDLYQVCYEGGTAEQVIAACTGVIANQQGDKNDIATAFKNRANAYDDKHKYALAIKDYSDAIRLDP